MPAVKTRAKPPAKPGASPCPCTIKVLMLYADLTTGNRVLRTFDALLHRCGKEVQFQSDMWKFDTLRTESIRRLAAKDAEEADLILVSAHGAEPLPDEVKAWCANWVVNRPKHPSALVALVDNSHSPLAGPDAPESYLQAVARQAEMDFFSVEAEEEDDLPFRRDAGEGNQPPPMLEAFCRKNAHPPAPASSPLKPPH